MTAGPDNQRQFTTLPPLGLYVHLPWCIRKCPYCDFNSHEAKAEIPESAYIDALLADLEQELPSIWGRTPVSVFIGGGTPSLFSPESLDRLLGGLRALTGLPPTAEITLEANPGTFEQEKFKGFRDIGINRLSIGVQSFSDESLKALGRVHDGGEAMRAIDIAQAAGFADINIDLMFGLPGQTFDMAMDDINRGIAANPTHVSYYELTLEPNTLFAARPPTLPVDDIRVDMQEQGIARLAEAGFQRYEVSAFAKYGKRCQHNLNYWLFGDYLGIGAGAHGKISDAATGLITRRWKHKNPNKYLQTAHTKDRIGDESHLPIEDTALEFLMNALRLVEGFSPTLFLEHTGVPLEIWRRELEAAELAGHLHREPGTIKATTAGFTYLNDVLERFLPDDKPRRPFIPLVVER